MINWKNENNKEKLTFREQTIHESLKHVNSVFDGKIDKVGIDEYVEWWSKLCVILHEHCWWDFRTGRWQYLLFRFFCTNLTHELIWELVHLLLVSWWLGSPLFCNIRKCYSRNSFSNLLTFCYLSSWQACWSRSFWRLISSVYPLSESKMNYNWDWDRKKWWARGIDFSALTTARCLQPRMQRSRRKLAETRHRAATFELVFEALRQFCHPSHWTLVFYRSKHCAIVFKKCFNFFFFELVNFHKEIQNLSDLTNIIEHFSFHSILEVLVIRYEAQHIKNRLRL